MFGHFPQQDNMHALLSRRRPHRVVELRPACRTYKVDVAWTRNSKWEHTSQWCSDEKKHGQDCGHVMLLRVLLSSIPWWMMTSVCMQLFKVMTYLYLYAFGVHASHCIHVSLWPWHQICRLFHYQSVGHAKCRSSWYCDDACNVGLWIWTLDDQQCLGS